MSTDYGEKERQFLATLEADTGRPLDGWMAAIAAQGLVHRNDIIDWLRRQGFMFSKASWLERIHNNGGRPIYEGTGTRRERPRARPRPPLPSTPASPAPPPAAPAAASKPPADAPLPPPALPAVAPATDASALDALLARAKAFRPLAVYLMAEIRKSTPDVVVLPREGYLVFHAHGLDFALLAISAKELRLGLALETPPAEGPLEPARLALRGAPPMTRMAILTDARQVTPALMAAVAQAATGA